MKLLITGYKGQVGSELVSAFAPTKHQLVLVSRKELDCVDLHKVHSFLSEVNPDLIINAAAYTAVDKAEEEEQLALQINRDFVKELVSYCQQAEIPILHLSTDYVFDGMKSTSYSEKDTPNPQGVYGLSKWKGEQAIQEGLTQYIILRVSWVFGLQGTNFVKSILKFASYREQLTIVADQRGRPTAARDIARVVLYLVELINQPGFTAWGIYHYAGESETNWYEFAHTFISMAKEKHKALNWADLVPIRSEEYPCRVKRPKNSILNTDKIKKELGIECHAWQDYLPEMLDHFFKEATTNDRFN